MIRVGVAGWDYPDWMGVVYPSRRGAGFDRLAYLASFVDLVEINSTFYRDVEPSRSSSWVGRTAHRPVFRFTAKAHRSWTHEPAADLGAAVASGLRGLAPLREAGVMGALLLQFPQRFHHGPRALEHLERLLESLRDWPAVVEVRHVSWDREEAAEWFRERGAGWCVVDQPRVGGSTAPPRPRATAAVGYLRLHGRNAAEWFREGAGRDARYDYLYSREDLRSLAGVAQEVGRACEEVFVVQNNHFRGQALANALQMRHLLEGRPPEAPASLVRAFPDLAGSVVRAQPELF